MPIISRLLLIIICLDNQLRYSTWCMKDNAQNYTMYTCTMIDHNNS